MRLLGRLLTLLIVGALLGVLGLFLWRGVAGQVVDTATREEGTRSSVAYEVPAGGDGLRFSVPPHARSLTLLLNAVVPQGLFTPLDEREPLPYSVRVSRPGQEDLVLAAEGRTLFYGDVAAPQTRLSLAGQGQEVTFGRTFRVPVPPDAGRVTVVVEDAAPEIVQVLARAYVPRQLGAAPVEEQWMRLRPASRRQLAEGALYPEFLLTAEERRNLLVNRNQPLGPEGVADRDYVAVTLYRRDDPGPRIRPPETPPGQYADAVLTASFEVAAGVHAVSAVSPGGAAAVEAALAATWHGERIGEARSWRVAPGEPFMVPEAGLLTVAADGPVHVSLTARPEGAAPVVVADPSGRARAHDVSAAPVVVPVRHAGPADTLMRLDLRCRCLDADMPPGSVPVTVEELDGAGAVLRRSRVEHPVVPARFELITPDPAGRLSARTRHHWRLPPEVAALRVSAEAPVLVAAYNRPTDLVRRLAVPDDPHLRTWFSLPPADAPALLAADRSPLVEIRPQPPEADPDVLAGRYVYESFRPEGAWLGRTLYHARESTLDERGEAAAALFGRLPVGEPVTVSLTGQGAVVPTLFVRAPDAGPLTVHVDGRLRQQAPLRAGVTEVSLGRLATGDHALRIEAPPGAAVFLNHLQRPADLVKRTALAFEDGRLALTIPPPPRDLPPGEGDVLTLLLFTAVDAPACSVAAHLDGMRIAGTGPWASVTHDRTAWAVAPAGERTPPRKAEGIAPVAATTAPEPDPPAWVLGTPRPDRAPPVRLFLPIGADAVAAGPIDLALATDCPEALVGVARVTAGADPAWGLDIGPGLTED